jgi:S1-C subfamily serine protease
MAKKAYCEGRVRHLAWAIVVVTAAILAGTFFLQRHNAAEPNAAAGLPPLPDVGQQAAATTDVITSATPKGGVTLSRQMSGQAARNAALLQIPLENFQEVLNNVAATVKPSVAHIEATRPDPLGRSARVESIGSGVVVDRRGYVLTNYHVLEDALRISLTTYGKAGPATYEGKLVHSDAGSDLAVVRILGDTDLPVAKLGGSSPLEAGDWVLAVGSPLDLAQTVSFGIVSALRETVRIGGITYADMIQTDAHINKGNSGGPLVNIYGEVVGINTAIYTPDGAFTGIGFAIPVEHAMALLDELNIAPHRFSAAVANLAGRRIKTWNKGSWLGVEGVSLSGEMAARYGLPMDRGVYVTNVFVNSPAHRAGLRQGDILVWFDDSPIESIDALRTALSQTSPGKKVLLRACRANAVLDLNAITSAKW